MMTSIILLIKKNKHSFHIVLNYEIQKPILNIKLQMPTIYIDQNKKVKYEKLSFLIKNYINF